MLGATELKDKQLALVAVLVTLVVIQQGVLRLRLVQHVQMANMEVPLV